MMLPTLRQKAIKYAAVSSSIDEQTAVFFMKNFGCARKVHNIYVELLYKHLEKVNYKPGEKVPKNKFPEIKELKESYPYLKEVDSLALKNVKADFERSISRFNEQKDRKTYTKRAIRRDESGTEKLSFRGLRCMPKFHSRAQGYYSYTTDCQHANNNNKLKKDTIRLYGDTLYLPKVKKGIKLCIHRVLPEDAKINTVTVSMEADGKFYFSIQYSCTMPVEQKWREAAVNNNHSVLRDIKAIGLDYSQEHFYVASNGEAADHPHWVKDAEKKLAKLQRELSHMQKGSFNYLKKLKKIQKLHCHIANQRLDFVRKLASGLAKEYDVVAVEDIDLRAMAQTLNLAKNLNNHGFGMFRVMLNQKLLDKGSLLVRIDRWYPSTKMCSACGFVNDEVVLGVSEWTCPCCGTHHNRDINGATNIEGEGVRVFLSQLADLIKEEEETALKTKKFRAARKKRKKNPLLAA